MRCARRKKSALKKKRRAAVVRYGHLKAPEAMRTGADPVTYAAASSPISPAQVIR